MIAQARITSDTTASVHLAERSVEVSGVSIEDVRTQVKQIFIAEARAEGVRIDVLIEEPGIRHHLFVEPSGRIAARPPDDRPMFGPAHADAGPEAEADVPPGSEQVVSPDTEHDASPDTEPDAPERVSDAPVQPNDSQPDVSADAPEPAVPPAPVFAVPPAPDAATDVPAPEGSPASPRSPRSPQTASPSSPLTPAPAAPAGAAPFGPVPPPAPGPPPEPVAPSDPAAGSAVPPPVPGSPGAPSAGSPPEPPAAAADDEPTRVLSADDALRPQPLPGGHGRRAAAVTDPTPEPDGSAVPHEPTEPEAPTGPDEPGPDASTGPHEPTGPDAQAAQAPPSPSPVPQTATPAPSTPGDPFAPPASPVSQAPPQQGSASLPVGDSAQTHAQPNAQPHPSPSEPSYPQSAQPVTAEHESQVPAGHPSLGDLQAATPHVEEAPATKGLPGLLVRLSGGRISPAPNQAEQAERADVRRVRRSLDGPKNIAVVNLKGGAHKTTSSLMIAATLGITRGSVLAWDNNETRGTLAWRGSPGDHEKTALNLLHDLDSLNGPSTTIADLDRYVRPQVDTRFDILASDEDPGSMASIDASAFGRLNETLSRFYRLKVVDTGNNVRASNWLESVRSADQLVIVSTLREDTFNAAAWMIDELRATGLASHVDHAVTILSHSSKKGPDAYLKNRLLQHFGAHTRAIVEVPYENQFVDGAPLDWSRVHPRTKRAWLAATAEIVDGL